MTIAVEALAGNADRIFEQVRVEEQTRSELIELADIVEQDPYRGLRTGLRDIDQLAAKIKERGQLVPVLVWLRRGRYILLSGHRRAAALRSLGADTIKAIVYADRDLSRQDALDIAIDDNIDRNNFSKMELAALVARLVDEGMTQRTIATRLRLSNGTVSDYYRLNALPKDVRDAVDAGRIAVRAGLRLQDESDEARAAVLGHDKDGLLSLGDVVRLVESRKPAPDAPRRIARRGAPWSRESAVVGGLAWQRQRGDTREIRVRFPDDPTPEQRQALRSFLLEQVRSL